MQGTIAMTRRAQAPVALLDLGETRTMDDDELPSRTLPARPGARDPMQGEPAAAELADELVKARVEAALFAEPVTTVVVGRYSLLERIGAGGMGEVYAAYDPELDRKVAVKIVLPGSASDSADDRLYREAQTLARLSHPNVVQAYEVGRHGGGVFLAMEFVRGVPLDRWLAAPESPRPWREVLRAVIAVGRGLAAAHAAGLIHRDVKPSNVLVGDDGRVRVIDFGLARAQPAAGTGDASGAPADDSSQPDGAVRPVGAVGAVALTGAEVDAPADETPGARPNAFASLTRTGAVMGTPAYMPPEQIDGERADHRGDQWSFCAVVYEALYGARAFTGPDLPSLRTSIREDAPAAPPRGTQVPTGIHRALVRGLAARRDARFPDMDALLAALEAHAAPPRRRWPAIALAVALTGVGSVTVGAALLAMRADRGPAPCEAARGELDAVWNPARADRVRAAIQGTGVPYADAAWRNAERQIESYAAEWTAQRTDACEATYVRGEQTEELLERRRFCLDRRRDRLDALLGSIVGGHTDARAVEGIAEAVAALPDLAECRGGEQLIQGVRPPDSSATAARASTIRRRLADGHALADAGRYDDSVRLADTMTRAARALDYRPLVAEALLLAGSSRLRRGAGDDLARGRGQLVEAAGHAEASRHDGIALEVWNALANLRASERAPAAVGSDRAGEPTAYPFGPGAARGHALRAIAAAERIGDAGPRYALALKGLGDAQYRARELEDAERSLRAALATAERSQTAGGAPLVVADCVQALANTLEALARTGEARAAYERALVIYEAELGAYHPRLARLTYNFATFLTQAGDLARARALLDRSLAIRTALSGADSLDAARALLALADVEQQSGELERAADHARHSYDIYLATLGAGAPELVGPLVMRALVHHRAGQFADAASALREALAIQTTGETDDSLDVAIIRNNLGEALVGQGHHDDAIAQFDAAAVVFAALAADHPVLAALPRKGRGLALLGKRQPRAAARELDAALALLREHPGYPLELADTAWALARALRGADGWPDPRAEALAREAMEIYDAQSRPADRDAIAAWLAE